jgi:hypothetical protein
MPLVDEYGQPFVPKERRVRVVKRDGCDAFEGVTEDDGLRSMYAVQLRDGTIKFATVLDDLEWLS